MVNGHVFRRGPGRKGGKIPGDVSQLVSDASIFHPWSKKSPGTVKPTGVVVVVEVEFSPRTDPLSDWNRLASFCSGSFRARYGRLRQGS